LIRRSAKIAIEVLAVIVTGLVVLIGFAVWRLSTGPVEIEFLTPYVERALTPANKSFSVKIEHTVAKWGGWRRPVELEASEVRALRPDGTLLVRVPAATINISARALLSGTVAPTEIEVRQPRLMLERDESGRFVLGIGEGGKGDSVLRPALVAGLLSDKKSEPLSYLRAVRIVNASMTIRDRHLGIAWHAPLVNLGFERDAAGIRMGLDLAVAIKGKRIHLRGVGIYGKASRSADVVMSFTDLEPSLFAEEGEHSTVLAALNAVRLPFDGRLLLTMGKGGRIERLGIELFGGPGEFRLPGPEPRLLPVRAMHFQGDLTADFDRLHVERLSLDLGQSKLDARGTVEGLRGRAKVKAVAAMRTVPTAELDKYWPKGVAESTRQWILANVSGGMVRHVEAELRGEFGGGQEPDFQHVKGAFLYDGVSVTYIKGLPPVRGLAGSARFTEDTLDFNVREGKLEKLKLTGATVKIRGMTNPDPMQQRLEIKGNLEGALPEALRIIDMKPLGYATKMGVPPSAPHGVAKIGLTFEFPLLDALTLDDVSVEAKARIERLRWRKAFFGADVTNGRLDLNVDKTGMTVTGPFHAAGSNGTVRWVERFGDDEKVSRVVTMDGVADAKVREAFGLDASPHLTGPLRMRATLRRLKGGQEWIDAALDLRDARIDLPVLGWIKPAGTAGRATFVAPLVRGHIAAIRKLAIVSPGISARGAITLAPGGKAVSAIAFSRLKLGKTDAAIKIAMRKTGGYDVTVKGASLDVSGLMKPETKAVEAAERGEREPDLSLRADVDRVYFAPDRYLSAVRGRVARINGNWTDIKIDGLVSKGNPLRVRFADRGPGRALSVYSTDTGGVLRLLGIHDNVIGGVLDIRGSVRANKAEPFAGRVTVRNYRVIKAPILERAAGTGSFRDAQGALHKGGGVKFREFVAPFRYHDGSLRIEDGRAIGSEIGFTFQGRIDLRRERVEVDGTVVPNYTLNSLLGRVPLVGDILVGEKEGGVFAVAYTAEGPLRDPKIEMHPLSALTPGILRGLWRKFRGPSSAAAPDPVPFGKGR
jgi:hypothetical protein